eukprot:686925-Pyramimonas_sp.AAC.1
MFSSAVSPLAPRQHQNVATRSRFNHDNGALQLSREDARMPSCRIMTMGLIESSVTLLEIRETEWAMDHEITLQGELPHSGGHNTEVHTNRSVKLKSQIQESKRTSAGLLGPKPEGGVSNGIYTVR